MNNTYDTRDMLKKIREITKDKSHGEIRESLINRGLIKEQEEDIEAYSDEVPQTDTQQKGYKIGGNIIVIHGEESDDLQLTTLEKDAFKETIDEFNEQVSDLVTFNHLNVYSDNIEWSGTINDLEVDFYLSIGENNGVYISTDMSQITDEMVTIITNLNQFYELFKAKWADVLNERKGATNVEDI